MLKSKVASRLDRDKVLERNARINVKVVNAYKKLKGELGKLGVETEPSYNLEPPLGRNPTRFPIRKGGRNQQRPLTQYRLQLSHLDFS